MKYCSKNITTIEEYEVLAKNVTEHDFGIKNEQDVILLNQIITKFGIFPYVYGNTEKYVEILNPNIRIGICYEFLTNPSMTKFKKILLDNCPTLELDEILKIDKNVLKKTTIIMFESNKASDFIKIGYLPGVYLVPIKDFEFDVDLTGMKFWHLDFKHIEPPIISRLLEQVDEFDEIQVFIEDIGLILPSAKTSLIYIQNSNLESYDQNSKKVYDGQNLADNPNIKKLTCHFPLSGNFENNYTLLKYCGEDEHIHKIAARNRQYLYDSRFKKVKEVKEVKRRSETALHTVLK